MNYTKMISKEVSDGILVFNKRCFLPLPLAVRSILVTSRQLQVSRSYSYTLSNRGELLSQGKIICDKSLTFNSPLKLDIGIHEFKIAINDLLYINIFEGSITISYSFSF